MKRYFLFTIIVLLAACRGDKRHPDVSGIKVDVAVERFEQDFYRIDSNNVAAGLAQVRNAFPDFYGFYLGNIVGINPADTSGQAVVRYMLRDYGPVNAALQKKYPDLDWLRKELGTGFRYVKHYYPDYALPRLITFVGPLDAPGTLLTARYLGVGLHQFAGKDFPIYQDEVVRQLYPEYISRRFDKEYMTAACLRAVAEDLYPDQSVGRPLLEQMVEKGKQWYLLDHLMPDAPDSVKTGYTGAQLGWAKENEGNIWAYILKNENLFSIEPTVIQTYVGEAPFTQGFPEGSPGNIGPWIGWQIIRRYAERNNQLTLRQVLETPSRRIYEESRYKPK